MRNRITKALRALNLGLGLDRCPECGEDVLERQHVRAPSQQGHWRGVEADVCPTCGYTDVVEDEPTAP